MYKFKSFWDALLKGLFFGLMTCLVYAVFDNHEMPMVQRTFFESDTSVVRSRPDHSIRRFFALLYFRVQERMSGLWIGAMCLFAVSAFWGIAFKVGFLFPLFFTSCFFALGFLYLKFSEGFRKLKSFVRN